MPLICWKFVISDSEYVPHPEHPELAFRGCTAAVIASDEVEARTVAKAWAEENGCDPRWIDCVKRAVPVPLDRPAVLCWAEL